MSPVFIEGFDYYTSANAPSPTMTLDARWAYGMSSPTTQIDVAPGRYSGSQALYMNKTASGQDSLTALVANTSTQYAVGFAHKQAIMPSSDTLWISFCQNAFPASSNLDFYITSAGLIKVQNGTTVLGTTASPIATDWRYVEIAISAGSTSGTVSVLIDGQVELSLTNQNTIRVGTGVLDKIQFFCTQNSTYYIDDMYIISDTTTLGDSRVSVLVPESDTGTNQWSVSPPSLSSHYLAVNGTTPNYDSYVYMNAANKKDLYNFTDLTYTPSSIYAVQPIFAARKDADASKSIRMDLVTNSSTYNDSSQTLQNSSSTFYRMEGTILNTNPVTSQSWTAADLNNIQMGPETI